MRYDYTTIKITKIRNSNNTKKAGHSYTACGNAKWYGYSENNLTVSCKTKYVTIILHTNYTTGHFPRENKLIFTQNCTHVFRKDWFIMT